MKTIAPAPLSPQSLFEDSYEGLAPRMNAILGGHIDLTDSNMTQKGKVEAGQLKFIAIATETAQAVVDALHERGVWAWTGRGRIRFSFHGYNGGDDVDRIVAALCAAWPG